MKERPILMSTDMVKALLDGRKTQTRRLLKHQPLDVLPMNNPIEDGWVTLMTRNPNHGQVIKCRYGVVGDRLWVRETWYSTIDKKELLGYVADGDYPHKQEYRIRPSIFMYRKFSRITLEITDIRVQRLQEISEDDAVAEGIQRLPLQENEIGCWYSATPENHKSHGRTRVMAYKKLWDSINSKSGHGWDKNEWVWAISFKRISSTNNKVSFKDCR